MRLSRVCEDALSAPPATSPVGRAARPFRHHHETFQSGEELQSGDRFGQPRRPTTRDFKMDHPAIRKLGRSALIASGVALLLCRTSFAQTVHMFDEAPSLEQLRSIMIPESQSGASRTIVIQ